MWSIPIKSDTCSSIFDVWCEGYREMRWTHSALLGSEWNLLSAPAVDPSSRIGLAFGDPQMSKRGEARVLSRSRMPFGPEPSRDAQASGTTGHQSAHHDHADMARYRVNGTFCQCITGAACTGHQQSVATLVRQARVAQSTKKPPWSFACLNAANDFAVPARSSQPNPTNSTNPPNPYRRGPVRRSARP